jgi:hypothetical protein
MSILPSHDRHNLRAGAGEILESLHERVRGLEEENLRQQILIAELLMKNEELRIAAKSIDR